MVDSHPSSPSQVIFQIWIWQEIIQNVCFTFETLLYGWNGIGNEKLSSTRLLREKISFLRNKSFCGEDNYNNKRHKNIFNFVLFLKRGKIKSYFLADFFFCSKYRESGNFPIAHPSKWRSEYCRFPLLWGSGPKSTDKANSTVIDIEVCLGDSLSALNALLSRWLKNAVWPKALLRGHLLLSAWSTLRSRPNLFASSGNHPKVQPSSRTPHGDS